MKKLFLLPLSLLALVACGPQGGQEQTPAEPLFVLNAENFAMVDSTQSSSYAKYNGDHTYGEYTVTSAQVMKNAYSGVTPDYQVLQFQKTAGTLTVASVKVSKVVVEYVNTYDLSDNYVSATFGGETYSLSAEEIAASVAAKEDTGSAKASGDQTYPLYKFTYTLNINASAAGELKLVAGNAGAVYLASIAVY